MRVLLKEDMYDDETGAFQGHRRDDEKRRRSPPRIQLHCFESCLQSTAFWGVLIKSHELSL